MPQLVASPQHLSKILDILTAGVAVAARVAAEAMRRPQIEAVPTKSV